MAATMGEHASSTSESDDQSDSSPEEMTSVMKAKQVNDDLSEDDNDDESEDEQEAENDDDSGGEQEDENAELRAIKEELSNMPFDELQKLKNKLGSKIFNEALYGKRNRSTEKKVFKRENKNRPTEVSSKRKVGRLREVVQTKKKLSRDPRFDDLSGEYDEQFFKKAYSFIDDVKVREKHKLIKKLKKEQDPDKKKQIELLISRMNQQQKAALEKTKSQNRDMERKKKEKMLVKEGKTPFYLKKSEKKKLDLAEKYRELTKNNKLENYISKKRKKNATKDRKLLPNRHTKF